jgi:hypothetical protein
MLIVQDKLISEDIIEEEFLCNLSACKGACCWEGDFGAPLETAELETLEKIYDEVKPFLTEAGKKAIEEQGVFVYNEVYKEHSTPLIENAACAYITYEENGTAKCGIEKAHEAGKTDFKKPISCHLYPIRVKKKHNVPFETLTYDVWDICSAACELGKKEQLPIYKFLKDALIRKYGVSFYEELEEAVKVWKE